MHWILVYNALFFFDFLFNRIVPNLYISNAGLGTEAEKVEKLSPFFVRPAWVFAIGCKSRTSPDSGNR